MVLNRDDPKILNERASREYIEYVVCVYMDNIEFPKNKTIRKECAI